MAESPALSHSSVSDAERASLASDRTCVPVINCPFCGGAAICDPVQHGYFQVFCRSVITCGAAGSPRPTPGEAIAMWNRRAGQHVVATEGALSWRCFHCSYIAFTRDEAIAHFGSVMNERQPACIDATAEMSGGYATTGRNGWKTRN
jgi:hypothetical protein